MKEEKRTLEYSGIPLKRDFRDRLWKMKYKISGEVGRDVKWPEFFDILINSSDESKMKGEIEKLKRK